MRPAAIWTLLLLAPLVGGCTFGNNPAPAIGPTEAGHYPAPPAGVPRPRVAVAPFHVTTDHGFARDIDLTDAAADEMMKLMDGTARFNLIERVRLAQMLREENLIDALEPGEWTRPAQLPGVSYVVIGRVLSLSVVAEDPAVKFGMSKMKQWVGMGEDKNRRVNLTVTCNVDVRMVDPATGSPAVDVPHAFRKTATAAALGLDVSNQDLSALALKRNEAETLVRLVLDDELRQMLPQVDALLLARVSSPVAVPASTFPSARGSAIPRSNLAAPELLHRICPECGSDVSGFDEFCPNCGARLPRPNVRPTSQPAR